MSSVMPFTFNVVELCVAIINEKPWPRAREVLRHLKMMQKHQKLEI